MSQLETTLRNNLKQVRQRIEAACKKYQHSAPLQLMAVTKGQDVEKVKILNHLGLSYCGENYAQELFAKAQTAGLEDTNWSFIGALQGKKIRKIMEQCSEIHSLSSMKHAKAIARHAVDLGKAPYPVFITVNADREESKSGLFFEDLAAFSQELQDQHSHEILVKGIMAVPSREHANWQENDPIPDTYLHLREAANATGQGILSLGMSRDLELAIAAGTNLLRIGSDLLGPRAVAKPS